MIQCRQKKEPETVRERCRHIFGNEPPVMQVWEPEFDYADKELQALAGTDWRQITSCHLSTYYVLNLVYHEPMQPELFRYLFPLCLAEWHDTVLANGYGDHFEESLMRALRRPYLWQQMMDAEQRKLVRSFLIETLLERMDKERGFDSSMTWLPAFNALGDVATVIRTVWSRWWALDTQGKAVCALQYAAYLIYSPEDNPLWPKTCPFVLNPLYDSEPWSADNLAFLRKELTVEKLLIAVQRAAKIVDKAPEFSLAERIVQDAKEACDIIEIQIEDLFAGLMSGK